jgi:hypothetical protein
MAGYLYALRGDGVEQRREAALHMRELAGGPHEIDVLAQIMPALAASRAGFAPAGRVDGEPVAGRDIGAGCVHLHHLARQFMAEHQRLADHEIAIGAMEEVMHVRAANASRPEADAHHAFGKRRQGGLH